MRPAEPTDPTTGTFATWMSAGTYVDSDHPAVTAFAGLRSTGATDTECAVALFYSVRDGCRHDRYRLDLSPHGMKASSVLTTGHVWCVTKRALLAAACRARDIPARLGFADVRNHLSTKRMRQSMGTNIFIWHGFTEIRLDGKWCKATPAFNVELCDLFGLLPLESNGQEDSLYHLFDRTGRRHMEYVADRGSFDVPLARINADLRSFYPA